MREDAPDVAAIKPVCIRLFAYRGMQEWPPRIIAYPDWEMGYAAAAAGLDVLESIANEARPFLEERAGLANQRAVRQLLNFLLSFTVFWLFYCRLLFCQAMRFSARNKKTP